MLNYKLLRESSLHIGNKKLETKIFQRIQKLWGLQAVSQQELQWFQGAVSKEHIPSAILWEQAVTVLTPSLAAGQEGCN